MGTLRRRRERLYTPRRRKDSRTLPLWDETEEDNGVYYKCWHCGFTCNDKRDTLGNENSTNKKTHSTFSVEAKPGSGPIGIDGFVNKTKGGKPSVSLTIEDLHRTVTLVRVDSSGNPVEPKHYHSTSTAGGCPFCGTLNWRGDY